MGSSSKKLIKPVILPSNYTSTNAAESFPDPSHGEVTWHTLFTQLQTPTSDMSAGIAVCPSHTGHLCNHRHTQAEIYYILEGRGIVTIDGSSHPVEKGSTVFIPGDAEHGIVNNGEEPLKWFYIFPTGDFSEVVYRFSEKVSEKAKL